MNIKRKKTLYFIALSIILIFSGAIACAADGVTKEAKPSDKSIGQVVWIKGTVQATLPDSTARTLKRRDAIYEKDTLTSGPDGTGQVVFSDGGLLALRSDSAIKISEYKFDKATPSTNKNVVEVVKGGFRTITGAIAKTNPNGYEVKTPVATIGVRGTDFSIIYSEKCDKNSDSAKCGLAVKINKGIVSLDNAEGGITLTAGSKNSFGYVKSGKQSPFLSSQDLGGMFLDDLSMQPASWGGPGGSGGSSSGSGGGGFCIQ
jgi:hypothetical protein